jgi:carbonic anhydrase
MATAIQENLEKSNAKYASNFTEGDLVLPPAKKYLVRSSSPLLLIHNHLLINVFSVTCMDARIDPAAAFGINLGDAHVIRNAGASAKDALRSIIISEQLLGTTEILLVKHTGCGMLTFTDEVAHGVVKKNLGDEAAKEIEALKFLPFPELEGAVKDDIAFLKGSKAVPDSITITGWLYEVETGKVKKVV